MNKIKEKFKNIQGKIIKFFLLLSVVGLIFGTFLSMNFMGEHEQVLSIEGERISNLDADKTSRAMRLISPDLNESFDSESINERAIEWIIVTRRVNDFAKENNLSVNSKKVKEYIKNLSVFKEKGNFSQSKYNEILNRSQLKKSFFESFIEKKLTFDLIEKTISKDLFKKNDSLFKLVQQNSVEVVLDVAYSKINQVQDFSFEGAKIKKYSFLKNYKFKTDSGEREVSGKELLKKHPAITIEDLMSKKNDELRKIILNNKEFKSLEEKFQQSKKKNFLINYFEDFLEFDESIESLSSSQKYIKFSQEKLAPEESLINSAVTNKIKAGDVGDIFVFKNNEKVWAIKILEKESVLREEEYKNFKENSAQIKSTLFFNILQSQ